ncbi:glycosyltransferase family 4 protein [Enterovirga aerilata]|uniref:Glycosyltransferase family 4 protein n=1 Tax=Enterovirga aerilata TaxID=2730920 RepID=A0A849I2G4_9HYPH|nr:glycosyltransferase family 1 protein [Enterovirga sp. DB1703]NNM73572.1 glycosyltransferase family 4 protein [Enterovirga sp. DB1703]
MSGRPVLVDATRLLTRLKHPSPSGIDRVDLAYARCFLTGAPDRLAVGIGHFGPRILPDRTRDNLVRTIADRWREELPAERDPVLAELRRRLGGEPAAPGPTRSAAAGRLPRLKHEIADQAIKLAGLSWRPAEAAPRDAIYLHTSHLRLDRPEHFAWLEKRPDVRAVFFIHDLIPIDFPEYVVPGEDLRHRTRMATVARHAAAALVNSEAVGARFAAWCADEGVPVPPVTVAPLGVEEVFLRTARQDAAGRPYFVICSTIEARKNHLLLLQVWRELAWRLGAETPALVIVGRRGWESEAAVDLLDRSPALRGHVFEASGLSTGGLARLVAGARALLMPSFAEGYGIPIAEALSMGTPVLASDIPVHREVAGERARYLHPLDGPGWKAAIEELAAGPARTAPDGYAPPTWDAHFGIVNHVLARL